MLYVLNSFENKIRKEENKVIHKNIESIISSKSKIKDRITPDYQEYCFSNIPSTIMNHFKPDNNRQYLPDETFSARAS
jgi:hypothetical protein